MRPPPPSLPPPGLRGLGISSQPGPATAGIPACRCETGSKRRIATHFLPPHRSSWAARTWCGARCARCAPACSTSTPFPSGGTCLCSAVHFVCCALSCLAFTYARLVARMHSKDNAAPNLTLRAPALRHPVPRLAEFLAYCMSYCFVTSLFNMIERPERRVREMLPPERVPHVDVFICTYSGRQCCLAGPRAPEVLKCMLNVLPGPLMVLQHGSQSSAASS